MSRLRVWGLSAALVAVGGTAAAAAPPGGQTTLFDKLFGPKPPKPAGPTASAPQRPLTITTPLSQDVLADALRAEQDAYLRRVTVCTELRRVAVERDDLALARQADELERQATALYNARVAGLGVSRVKAPLPAGDSTAARNDAGSIRTAAEKLAAPPAPTPGTSTAQVREVKP